MLKEKHHICRSSTWLRCVGSSISTNRKTACHCPPFAHTTAATWGCKKFGRLSLMKSKEIYRQLFQGFYFCICFFSGSDCFHDGAMFNGLDCRICGSFMRPVAVAGASGGLVSALFQLLRDQPPQSLWESIQCPPCDVSLIGSGTTTDSLFDLKSIFLGIIIGLLLGPIFDCISLLRQLWSLQLRARVGVGAQTREPYRVLG